MKNYEAIVIGNGVSGNVAVQTAEEGNKTALFDKPPVGGTCPKRRVQTVQDTYTYGG